MNCQYLTSSFGSTRSATSLSSNPHIIEKITRLSPSSSSLIKSHHGEAHDIPPRLIHIEISSSESTKAITNSTNSHHDHDELHDTPRTIRSDISSSEFVNPDDASWCRLGDIYISNSHEEPLGWKEQLLQPFLSCGLCTEGTEDEDSLMGGEPEIDTDWGTLIWTLSGLEFIRLSAALNPMCWNLLVMTKLSYQTWVWAWDRVLNKFFLHNKNRMNNSIAMSNVVTISVGKQCIHFISLTLDVYSSCTFNLQRFCHISVHGMKGQDKS